MKLPSVPFGVKSVKLTGPPREVDSLAVNGDLLVAWRFGSYAKDHRSNKQYHLAFYLPGYGWRACLWDEMDDQPCRVWPVSEQTIWIDTSQGRLIHLSLSGGEVITATSAHIEKEVCIMHADEDNVWICHLEANRIRQLRLTENSFSTIYEKQFGEIVYSMHPTADGTWIVEEGLFKCVVRSSSLEDVIHSENEQEIFRHPPFLLKQAEGSFYYTSDPRRSWHRMPIKVEKKNDYITFFAQHSDAFYAAVYRSHQKEIEFYRFESKESSLPECMWKIPDFYLRKQFALYNGFLCITNLYPIRISNRKNAPENHGFLVWDPKFNVFYKDIPEISCAHARHIVGCKLQIPAAWSGIDGEQGYRTPSR